MFNDLYHILISCLKSRDNAIDFCFSSINKRERERGREREGVRERESEFKHTQENIYCISILRTMFRYQTVRINESYLISLVFFEPE